MAKARAALPKMEIGGIYPMWGSKNKFLVLSVHVYLIDLDMDIRGLKVRISDDGATDQLFLPPSYNIDWDQEPPAWAKFPVVVFCDEKQKEAFSRYLIDECRKFYAEYDFPKKLCTTWLKFRKFSRKLSRDALIEYLKGVAEKKGKPFWMPDNLAAEIEKERVAAEEKKARQKKYSRTHEESNAQTSPKGFREFRDL